MDDYQKRQDAARATRQHFDRLKGLTRTKGPQRGDYELCRKLDKYRLDYRKFPKDRKKISAEIEGIQRERRAKHINV